jgi:hypothetical protein
MDQPPALRALDDARLRALADPGINTSVKRANRLGTALAALQRAAADLPPEAVRDLDALFADDVLGHPDQPDTVLGRIAAGTYRTRPPLGQALTKASQRDIMDGIADLNRAAGRDRFWWQQRGERPWSRHTRKPLNPQGHTVLRRALSTPGPARREPYRLRLLAALEILWATGVTPGGLVAADTTDLAPDHSTIRLTINPPGRTAPTVQTLTLTRQARAALNLWLPVRRQVVAAHLEEGPDHPANQALFITLWWSAGTYPATGQPRKIPPGLRILDEGLERSYSKWAAALNAENHGKPGWPVPGDLYQVSRGGAAELLAAQKPRRAQKGT